MAHSVFSPRLVELQRQIEAGHAGALDTFWREVEERGAPLIEPIEDDDQNMLVTFLWRAGEEVRNVVVVGGIAGIRFGENQMEHVPNTDLWCRTYRARKDMRTTYWLAPNDSLVQRRKTIRLTKNRFGRCWSCQARRHSLGLCPGPMCLPVKWNFIGFTVKLSATNIASGRIRRPTTQPVANLTVCCSCLMVGPAFI